MSECLYQNKTSRMVILKCIGPNSFYLEKVVMPSETFWFEAPEAARLEIWEMSTSGQMLNLRADVADYAVSDDPKASTDTPQTSETGAWQQTPANRLTNPEPVKTVVTNRS